MSLKVKLLLILGIAVGLTLVTIHIFFPQQFVKWAAAIVVVGIILLIVFMRRKKKRRELRQWYYEHKGRFYRYSIEQLNEEISRIRLQKSDLERRLNILAKANPKVVLFGEDRFNTIESQMRSISWDLEKLDKQEEAIEEVIANKRAGKNYTNLFR